MVKIIVIGAAGRMGRQVIAEATRDKDVRVVGGVDGPGLPDIGVDLGILARVDPLGVAATDDLESIIGEADVLVEFTTPQATVEHAQMASQHEKPIVIGTTGLDSEQLAVVRRVAERIPVLMSPNMSVGINLLLKILPLVARALGGGYDVEIIEAHHRMKKDAPSGTALKLAEVIADALNAELDQVATYGRKGIAPRAEGEIGLHAVRGGGIVGDHSVIFVNESEQIEIAHRAFSRQTLALGAIRAAKFIANQPPGLYTMLDVLSHDIG